ncbi:hypothetical protein LENED_004232 [Lentinula edodes]|uniref:Uncharacterized protein n=1 Tax=Lentinula edodes TaxID=5353 RepID=A0A1Q3E6B7_LENED|nr:hypothetical protein LENED_004232 [Lentinula edodes]
MPSDAKGLAAATLLLIDLPLLSLPRSSDLSITVYPDCLSSLGIQLRSSMRLSIVYFMLGLGLSLLSNVRAMPLSNKGDAMYKRTENNEVFLEFDSELQKDRASILLTSGWPYISKSMPPAMNLQQSNVKVSVGHGHSTSTSLQTIQFKIYADPQLQTLKGYGTIRLNNQVNLLSE